RYDDPAWLNGAFDVLKSGLEALNIDGDHPAVAFTLSPGLDMDVIIGERRAWKANFDRSISYLLPKGSYAEAIGGQMVVDEFLLGMMPDAEWTPYQFEPERGVSSSLLTSWMEKLS